MANFDIQAGWNYHNATKHSRHSIRTNPHSLDWANQPLPIEFGRFAQRHASKRGRNRPQTIYFLGFTRKGRAVQNPALRKTA
jgi:hypothetical protein